MRFATAVATTALAVMVNGERSTEELQRMWVNYKVTHKRNYGDVEEAKRFENFRKSVAEGDRIAKENPHATMSPNSFSDMSEEEFNGFYRSGLVDVDESLLKGANTNLPVSAADYNKYKDHRDLAGFNWVNTDPPCVTPVKNQGSCGSCWAFSATGALEAQWAIRGHELVSLSEEELVACADAHGCSGSDYSNAFDRIIEWKGIVTEKAYPYADSRHTSSDEVPCKNVTGEPIGARMTEYFYDYVNESALYTLVKTKGPVSIGVDSGCWKSYSGGILTSCVENAVDHAALVVGHGYDQGVEYWVVKNSWGSSWGENGYIRIQYGKNLCQLTQRKVGIPTVEEMESPALVPSDHGMAPGVVTPPPLNPYRIPPNVPYTDVVCIAGKDCTCPDLGIVSGKAGGSDVCTVIIVLPILGSFLFLFLGAVLFSCIMSKPRKIAEGEFARSLVEYKKKQREAREARDRQEASPFNTSTHINVAD